MNTVAVIIPTYKEVLNIPLICQAIKQNLSAENYKILIVDDDSQDGSEQAVVKQQQSGVNVEIITRQHERGLSSAVIRGMQESQDSEYIVVMDADGSHPATAIPSMLQKLAANQADFCLGSRYVQGGTLSSSWGIFRRLNSLFATWCASFLVKVKDPMSGFFAFKRAKVDNWYKFSPVGYKIALELLVKGGFEQVVEIPIHFADRQHGDSKMDVRVQFNYLRHLRRLYAYKLPVFSEVFQFAFVGASGFVVDLTAYYALQLLVDFSHTTARALAFWFAVSWNWFWNRTLTFSDYRKDKKLTQWLAFIAVSLSGFAINWGSYLVLTNNLQFFDNYRVLALIVGVLLGMGFNFTFSRILVFHKLERENFHHLR